MQIQFTALKTLGIDGGSQVLDEQINNVAKAFKAIEDLAGRANGLVPLRADRTIDPVFLGSLVTPALFHVSVVSTANNPVTATLPVVAGKSHAIVALQLVRVATAAVAGGAVLTSTSTNLPGAPSWSAGNAIAAGQSIIDLDYQPANPLQAAAPGTATTITMPAAGANVINRINVSYLVL